MTLDERLHPLAQALVRADGREAAIGPGRWHVLFGGRQRTLLMPEGTYGFQKRCLRFFLGDSARALYARALLKANSLFPRSGLLPEFRLPRARHGFAPFRLPVREPAHGAIQIGSAGPYQKASVLLMSARGEEFALAKVALADSANQRVRAEAGWLRNLDGIPPLREHVPHLLAEGAAGNGRRYLVTTLAPGTRMTRSFTSGHRAFLGKLARVHREPAKFPASPCSSQLETMLAQLDAYVPRIGAETLHDAMRDCREMLRDWAGPFVVAQGDFAPWNIRMRDDRLFVFDWEYARRGANPLMDLYNFFVIQRALSARPVSNGFLANVTRLAEETARALYPEWKWRPRALSALLLAYLLEVILSYTHASGRLERTHPVIASYWRLIERRRQWMAA